MEGEEEVRAGQVGGRRWRIGREEGREEGREGWNKIEGRAERKGEKEADRWEWNGGLSRSPFLSLFHLPDRLRQE